MSVDITRRVDSAINIKDEGSVKRLLSESLQQNWYSELEAYVLKKARQLVVLDDLDFAKTICLTIIDINLDSLEAVNLYQSVQAAIVKRDGERRKKAEAESLATFKEKAGEAPVKKDPPKTFKSVSTPKTGKTVYLDQDFNNHYSSKTWDLMFGLANGRFILKEEAMSLDYGVSVEASFFNQGENIAIGADIRGDAGLLTFMGEQAVDWSSAAVVSMTLLRMNRYFTLRLGGYVFGYNFAPDNEGAELWYTPSLGLGFREVRFGKSGRFEIGLDWLALHLWEKAHIADVNAYMATTFTYAKLQDFDMYFRIGIHDTFAIKTTGIVNDARILIALGVGNHD